MLWRGQRESDNVEDMRGGGFPGGGTGIALGGGGCGTVIIIILALLFGVDPSRLLNGGSPNQPDQPAPTQSQPRQQNGATEDEGKKFARTILASTEDIWTRELPKQTGNRFRYRAPKLVLFTNSISSACGRASASTGPFYCPADEKVYIDLAFYNELKNRFHAPGDSAQAYVLAHEVGHHIQKILGTSDKVDAMQSRVGQAQANQLSVRLELQADFYAGVWAHFVQQQGLLEAGDVENALRAASAVGDDNIQRQTQGYVVPDSFTHGSSQQRMQAFQLGFQSGDIQQGSKFFQ